MTIQFATEFFPCQLVFHDVLLQLPGSPKESRLLAIGPPCSPSQEPTAMTPLITPPHSENFHYGHRLQNHYKKVFNNVFSTALCTAKILHHQCNQEVFALPGLCSSICKHCLKIIPISIPDRHIVDSLLVRHRLWIFLPWKLGNTALVLATSFKGAAGVISEKKKNHLREINFLPPCHPVSDRATGESQFGGYYLFPAEY